MSRVIYYETNDQRTAYIKQAQKAGEQLLHDDFGTGPGGKNTLTFETPAPDIQRIPSEVQLLGRRIAEFPGGIRLGDIIRYLGLKFEGADNELW